MHKRPNTGEGIGYLLQYSWASLVAQLVNSLPAVQKTWVRSVGWEDPLEIAQGTLHTISFHLNNNPLGLVLSPFHRCSA